MNLGTVLNTLYLNLYNSLISVLSEMMGIYHFEFLRSLFFYYNFFTFKDKTKDTSAESPSCDGYKNSSLLDSIK